MTTHDPSASYVCGPREFSNIFHLSSPIRKAKFWSYLVNVAHTVKFIKQQLSCKVFVHISWEHPIYFFFENFTVLVVTKMRGGNLSHSLTLSVLGLFQ
jgi:hypothetical protein